MPIFRKKGFEIIDTHHEIALVVCTALGSPYVEWKPIVSPFSSTYSILLYDRAGYGKSEVADSERSPKNIAKELNDLLTELLPNKKYLLIGHSLGGLIAEQFVRDYPTNVIGAIFIDPATTEERSFKEQLTERQYKRSGIDKATMIKQGIWAGKLGVLKLLTPLLKKSIPFYYYKNYDGATTKAILEHQTQLKTYKTLWQEYTAFKNQEQVKKELLANPFPKIPVRLLKHDPDVMVEEIVNFGGLTEAEARQIDALWHELMDNHYAALSPNFKAEISEKSGHYVHLTDSRIVEKYVTEIANIK
jgi:pimeloyl-ACP methyl ester carboxylesterase